MRAVAILVLICACDRVFFLDHITPAGDSRVSSDGDSDGPITGDAAFACGGRDFCDDFDRTSPVATGWDGLVDLSSGMMMLTPLASVSPPNALAVEFAGPNDEIYLAKDLAAPATRIVVELDLSLESSDLNTEVDLVALVWNTPPGSCTSAKLVLVTRGTPRRLALQETYETCEGLTYHDVGTTLGPGFQHIRIDVVLGAGSSVSVAAASSGAAAFQTAVPLTPSSIELQLGAPYIGSGIITGWRLLYDNLTADIQ